MDIIAGLRRRHFVSEESISFLALSLNLSRPAVRTSGDLNSWLAEHCERLASLKHPTLPTQTIAGCFTQEQPLRCNVTRPFARHY